MRLTPSTPPATARAAHALPIGLACLLILCGCDRTEPVDTSGLPPLIDETRHQADFLTAGDYTHLYPGRSVQRRARIVEASLRYGYTHIYLYVMNESDYDGTHFNFYDRPQEYRALLSEVRAAGLAPVVWLAPDDAPGLHAQLPPQRLMEIWNRFVPAIDDQVSSYVLGLEMDEYWSRAEQSALGKHLRSLTAKPIFVHLQPGLWEPALEEWASGLIYQYGFGKSTGQIQEKTRELRERLAAAGKLLIAGEYSHPNVRTSIVLGNAAMDAGAHGFGNGGTPRWRASPASGGQD